MAYVEPTGNDTQGIYEYFNYVNVAADGFFFPLIMLVIWVVTFIALKSFSSSRAFTVASFLVAALSMVLAIGNLVAPRWMYMSFILVAAGVLWLKLEAGAN